MNFWEKALASKFVGSPAIAAVTASVMLMSQFLAAQASKSSPGAGPAVDGGACCATAKADNTPNVNVLNILIFLFV